MERFFADCLQITTKVISVVDKNKEEYSKWLTTRHKREKTSATKLRLSHGLLFD